MKYIGILVAVMVLGGVGFFMLQKSPQYKNVEVVVNETQVGGGGAVVPQAPVQQSKSYAIVFGNTGYSPKEITIKKGDTVIFRNESSSATWPASAMHPTHTVYPGSSIAKCGTAEEQGIFDACKGIAKGNEWSFQFNKVGSWGYHDHLNVSFFGKIIVEE